MLCGGIAIEPYKQNRECDLCIICLALSTLALSSLLTFGCHMLAKSFMYVNLNIQ